MGLITLLLLGTFTLLYVSKSVPKKPEYMQKALTLISENMRYLAMAGVIYGLVAACLTPIMRNVMPMDMFVRMWANILLAMMALPYCFERIVSSHKDKINSAILGEVRGLVNAVIAWEKIVGIVGAVTCLVLFAMVFR
jgi:hypothetical protein